ncbi:MAG: G-D-S-L family lipolytic protein, partial [Bacteroidota bacterium]
EDGIELNNQYINGGVFSLDGLYFTPRGNAFAANIFIEYMNATFSASIPLISLADYPAVFFP